MQSTEFSRMLRSAREKKGWSRLQAYMKSLDVSANEIFTPDTLRKWETGEQAPMSIERIVGLAKLYGKPQLIEVRLHEAEESIKKCSPSERKSLGEQMKKLVNFSIAYRTANYK